MLKLNRCILATILLGCLGLIARAARAEDELWQTDFEAAKTKAKAEKKFLLLDFTGSDWCFWCTRLRAEVFDKEPFKTEGPKQFVFVELDFPQEKKQPAELKTQNEKLHKRYKVRGFPTVLLVDAEGELVAQTGYRPGGPEKYCEHLGNLLKLHESVVQMRAELAKATGLDRAKLLDRLVDAMLTVLPEDKQSDNWSKEIIVLDGENKAGLKVKHEVRLALAEVPRLINANKNDEAQKLIAKVLAMSGVAPAQKQEAWFAQGFILKSKADVVGCVKAMTKGLEADPDGPRAATIKMMLAQFEEMAKREDAAIKAKEALDKAAGPERLKALDKAVDAYTVVECRVGNKDCSEEVEKWYQEIVGLDADNKEGLRKKHEFRLYCLQGQRFLHVQKPAEAQAAFEKALAVPGITPGEIERCEIMKCNCLLAQRDYQGALDCAKKARETAKGTGAQLLNSIIQQAERRLAVEKNGEKPAAAGTPAAHADRAKNSVPRDPVDVPGRAATQEAAAAAPAEDGLWQTDFEAAKTRAKAENKLLLVNFTGSDWCSACKKVKIEVFDTKEFRSEVPKHFILVELDYPRGKKLPEEIRARNEKLADRYKVSSFPTLLLLDAEGEVVAKAYHLFGGAQKNIAQLAELREAYAALMKMKPELVNAKGLDRARLLDKIIDAYVKLDNQIAQLADWSNEIVALDADGKAGLKPKHACRACMAEYAKAKAERNADGMKAALEKALTIDGIGAQQKQHAYLTLVDLYRRQRDYPLVVKCLQLAIDADPNSPAVKRARDELTHFKAFIGAEERFAKARSRLDGTKGLERAQVLHQMYEERMAIMWVHPSPDGVHEAHEWSAEIISLDPENKAGLKAKHVVSAKYGEAATHVRNKDYAKARATLDEMAALPNLTNTEKASVAYIRSVLPTTNPPAAAPATKPDTPVKPAKQPALKVGDAAPALQTDRWLKGQPVDKFEPGKLYVVEFWASWCLPCLAAMPHLSDIQEKYKEQGVIVIAVDAREPEPSRGEACVKQFDRLMAFRVAAEKTADGKGLMAQKWLDAAGVPGMPSTWIIDRSGKIAWMGHPAQVERVLAGVLRGDYDPAKDRQLNAKLDSMNQAAATAVAKGDFDVAWKVYDQMDAIDPYSRLERDLGKVRILLHKKKDYAAASALIRQLADGPLKNDWSLQSKLAEEIVALPEQDHRDLDLALRLMKRVVELKNGEDWMTMKSLAAIYAAQGKWDKASELQTKVVNSLGGAAHDREKETLDRYRAEAEKK